MGRKYREYSYDDWKRVMDMLRAGYKSPEISMKLGIPRQTVESWRNGVVPPAAKWKAEPCIELGYTIGVLHKGDGSVSKSKLLKNKPWYQYEIILETIDPEFAETFSRAMSRLLSVNYHKPRWNEKRKVWRVKYQSKAFYEWYKKCEKQGLEGFKSYIEYNKETVKYYLKGLYDSEGYSYKNKYIRLYNTKKKLLEYVQLLLKKYFNIISTGPYLTVKAGTKTVINGVETILNQDCYGIQIGREKHVQKFLREIGFSIVRKQLGLKKHEKVFIEGKYVEPYKLVGLGLFKSSFSDTQ